MSSTSKAGGAANDARVQTDDDPARMFDTPATARSKSERTPAEQSYLEALADEAEEAVAGVKQQIKDLQATLADREKDAKQARAAVKGKVD